MDDLERIVGKGPDTKMVQRAHDLMIGLSSVQEQLLVANLLRRYLTRWYEISSYYKRETGDASSQWQDPYFSPLVDFKLPKTLLAITDQAFMKSIGMLSYEALQEAINDYCQFEGAIKRLVPEKQESFIERLKGALPGRHKSRQAYTLHSMRKEIDLAARIYANT